MKGKKLFSILLSILMICSTFGGISVSAYSSFYVNGSKASGKIYFEPINKKGSSFYAHIMEYKTKKAFFKYQVKKERLEVD